MKPQFAERPLTSEGPFRYGNAPAAATARGRSVTVNLAESPLSWLHARGHLEDRLFAAGECLRADYQRAGIAPNLTMRWHRRGEQGGRAADLHPTERQIAARARFDGAIAAAGSGLADILWRVVCAGEGLSHAEKALSWPARSGKLILRLALERVAEFYRIG